MRRWLLLSLLVPVLTGHAAEQGASEWLERMSKAFRESSYQGVLIFGNDRQWQTLSVSHALINNTEYEKFRHLTGIPREIIRRGDETTCIHPGEHSTRLDTALPVPLVGYDGGLDIGAVYEFQMREVSRVAGRYAQHIRVIPQDNFRYGYNLWLDQETGLLLRSELVNLQQQVLERFQFADINIGLNLTEDDFSPQGDGHTLAQHRHETINETPAEAVNWVPAWVPQGFQLASAGQVAVEPGNEDDAQPLRLMYSDGLASFTLFVDPAGAEGLPEIVSQWGATSAAVRYLTHDKLRYRITAVGELPSDAILKIAGSVAYQAVESK